MFVFADKSLIFFKIQPELYKKLLEEYVTETYKKCNNKIVEKITMKQKILFQNLKIPGKVCKLQ